MKNSFTVWPGASSDEALIIIIIIVVVVVVIVAARFLLLWPLVSGNPPRRTPLGASMQMLAPRACSGFAIQCN